jgi:hypothetical protein
MRWEQTTLTITNGSTLSPAIDLDANYGPRYVRRVLILAPTSLPETITVLVSLDNTTYVTLQSGGSDITIPQGKGTQINGFQARYLKLQAGSAVGADRVFGLTITAE